MWDECAIYIYLQVLEAGGLKGEGEVRTSQSEVSRRVCRPHARVSSGIYVCVRADPPLHTQKKAAEGALEVQPANAFRGR